MSDQNEHLQMYDLANRVARSSIAVIDTVITRGGFKGEEISTIGQLRDQAIQVTDLAEAFYSTLDNEEAPELPEE